MSRFHLNTFAANDDITIQSLIYVIPTCIPKFLLQIHEDFSFTAYHYGSRCTIKPLSVNRITRLTSWSAVEEAISVLCNMDVSRKEKVLIEQVSSTSSSSNVCQRKYSPETLVRQFEYFATSRAMYKRLREDYQLPSITTLTRLTSKCNNLKDHQFLQMFFGSLEDSQKTCLLLIDEVYVKPALHFHAGSIFGRAVNRPDQLANTVLGFKIVTFFGGPTILYKMLPVKCLDAAFMFEQFMIIWNCKKEADGNLFGIICDNNRTNQSFFSKFTCQVGKSWLTVDGLYLLFDFVHLLKSVRNNWITEKQQQIDFMDKDQHYTAKWSDIVDLFNVEKRHVPTFASQRSKRLS